MMSVPSSKPTRRNRVLILMYHHVGEFESPKNGKGQFCHVDRFRAHIRFLLRSSYRVISLRAAVDGLFGNACLPKQSVVLTFDDGYQDFYDFAWPIIQSFNVPATLFAVPGKMGGHADWLAGEKARSTRLMHADTLRELAAGGLTIGSHTMTHPRLGTLQTAEQQRELVDSKKALEDVLGQPVEYFAYPYSDYSNQTPDLLRDAGYRAGLTARRERADRAHSQFEMPRQGMSYKDTNLHLAFKLYVKHSRIKEAISSGRPARD